jgi:hypothetical protein
MTKSTFIQPLNLGSRNSLHDTIQEIIKQPPLKVLDTYKHYKGGMYLYLGEAIQEDTLTTMAIYKELNPRGCVFVRPINEFIEKFEHHPLGIQL